MADNKQQQQELQVNLNVETTPVLFTDNILMNTNEDGVVINFGQMFGFNSNQVRIVSRVGMSRSHAKKFLEELGKLLAMTEGQKQTGEKTKN